METREREDDFQIASATECTGLMPALTDEGGEANIRRLYDVTAARREKK